MIVRGKSVRLNVRYFKRDFKEKNKFLNLKVRQIENGNTSINFSKLYKE